MRRLATIDIGTNTVLLLVAEVDFHVRIRTLAERQAIIRLGRCVDADRKITEDGILKGQNVLMDYAEVARSYNVDGIFAFGTSALRDAVNREEVIRRWRDATGIDVTVLSGDEEALWTGRGGLMVFGNDVPDHALIVDIGGGSTEIIHVTQNRIASSVSLNIGSVRLTERFIRTDPVLRDEENALRNYAVEALRTVRQTWPQQTVAVGVAGTCTTLAAMIQRLDGYDKDRINGFEITADVLDGLISDLRGTTNIERQRLPGLQPARADVIIAGALILREAMAVLGIDKIRISDYGLRYGLVIKSLHKASG
jgi:exopolyphosphatase/guanosine-5'-triphosphate,3'-diphosphate pyrophosphatase